MGAWSLAQFFNLDETPMEQIHAGVHPQQPIKQKSLLLKKLSQVSTTRCQQDQAQAFADVSRISSQDIQNCPGVVWTYPRNSHQLIKLFQVGIHGHPPMRSQWLGLHGWLFCFGHGIVGRDQSFTSMDLVSWRWLDRMDDLVRSHRLKQDLDRFG